MKTSQEISDSLIATGSITSKEDFTGRAMFYASVRETKPIPVDLVIHEVDFNIAEYLQVSPYIGSFFGAKALGWQPMIANISATLPDSDFNYGKEYLMDAYRNVLRLEAVSRTGQVPVLKCLNSALAGPVIAMSVSENTEMDDVVTVNLSMLVMLLSLTSGDSVITVDYLHGAPSVDDVSKPVAKTVSNSVQDVTVTTQKG